jgi:hypothetical protein
VTLRAQPRAQVDDVRVVDVIVKNDHVEARAIHQLEDFGSRAHVTRRPLGRVEDAQERARHPSAALGDQQAQRARLLGHCGHQPLPRAWSPDDLPSSAAGTRRDQ